jgi:hypothetical protein
MIHEGDIYKYSEAIQIISGPDNGDTPTTKIGVVYAEYEVREYVDLRNLSTHRSYIVTCKQRLVVPNIGGIDTLSDEDLTGYSYYPAMLVSSVKLSVSTSGCKIMLVDYSPKTINTSVTTNQATADATGTSSSIMAQQTTGKSTSDTSSYEVSSSLGFFGAAPVGSAGGSYGKGKTTTAFSSTTNGTSSATDTQTTLSGSDSMSIKDWASYASLDTTDKGVPYPTWVWAQEYPWDVTQLHNSNGSENTDGESYIALPDFVQARLVNPSMGQIYPPSQLSLFGVNFLGTAKWLVQVPEGTNIDETVSFEHCVTPTQASHSVGDPTESDGATIYPALATLRTLTPFSSFDYEDPQNIDMVKLALDPVASEGADNGAVVGFVASQFLSLPVTTKTFRILSLANNVLVEGSGFSLPTSNDSVFSADLSNGSATLNVYFKIVSPLTSLTLYIKNWVSSSSSMCCMTVSVNGFIMYRHVDAGENASGSDNVTTVILRNQDFTSADFYDYLKQGFNTVTITIAPSDDPTGTANPGTYFIRALALG